MTATRLAIDTDNGATHLDADRRRVLLISLVFPPTSGPGAQRTAKFAKYLGDFGWQPIIWSAATMQRLPTDPQLGTDLPSGLLHFTCPAWEPERWLGCDRRGQASPRHRPTRLAAALQRLTRNLVPDDQVIWALRSLGPVLRLVHRERVDAIVTTFSPPSVHLLGWLLKMTTGKPWVADFRDLWTDDYSFDPAAVCWPGAHRWLEQRVLNGADAVIGVTPAQTTLLESRAPSRVEKFVTIANGVDLDDFEGIDRERSRARLNIRADRFNITYTGWFLTRHYAPGLAEGLARFRAWLGDRGTSDIRFVGKFSDDARRAFASAGVDVLTPGYQSHHDAIAYMTAADVLLLPVPTLGTNARSTVPGKLYEYLAAGRPILLIAPPGGQPERILTQCQAGTRVSPQPDAICAELQALWSAWQAGRERGGCTPQSLAPYERRNLTRKLATVLDSLMPTTRRNTQPSRDAHGDPVGCEPSREKDPSVGAAAVIS